MLTKKRVTFFIAFIASVVLLTKIFWFSLSSEKSSAPTLSPPVSNSFAVPTEQSLSSSPDHNLTLDSVSVAYVVIDTPQTLELIANFEEKFSGGRTEKEHHCRFLTSGGFYTKDKKPTGLFITNNIVYREKVSSDFLNGFLSVNENNQAAISVLPLLAPVKFSLQSGPLLFSERFPVSLKIRDDFSARRVAVGITTDDKLIFMIFFHRESPYDGPKLSALPEIIAELNDKARLNLKNVLNLDGGSASLFTAKNTRLRELSPVGSFICLK